MEEPSDTILELCEIVDDGLEIPAPIADAAIPSSEPLTEAKPSEPQEAYVLAMLGVHGGAGVTSLAVQTAYAAAERGDADVLLIDMNFERGSIAPYLDIAPSFLLEDLNAASGRMDADLARTFVKRYAKHLCVLSPKGELGGNDRVDAFAFLSLLDALSGQFSMIILDIPALWRSWISAALEAADECVLVTELRVPALHQTKTLRKDIIGILPECAPQILINKHERRHFRGGLSLNDAVKVLGSENLHCVCIDDDTLRAAVNIGKPAGAVKPDSRFVKSVNEWRSGMAAPSLKSALGIAPYKGPERRSGRAAMRRLKRA